MENSYMELLARFGIDIVAMLTLVFGMYYRRYKDKELVTTAAMFNIFVFAVLSVLSSVKFSLAAGFGLFAILALFTRAPSRSARSRSPTSSAAWHWR